MAQEHAGPSKRATTVVFSPDPPSVAGARTAVVALSGAGAERRGRASARARPDHALRTKGLGLSRSTTEGDDASEGIRSGSIHERRSGEGIRAGWARMVGR